MTGRHRTPSLVSVVVPVYNAVGVLPDQLAALAAQEYDAPFEVVLSDNGSTDGVGEAWRPWSTAYGLDLRLVDSSGVRGVSHARNVGCANARGELVVICDADDVVVPGWLAAMVEAAAGADIVGGRMDLSQLNPWPVCQWRVTYPAGVLPSKLGFLPYAQGCNIAVWRDVVGAIGGWDESLVAGGDDVDFSWRAQLAGYRVTAAPDAVVHYRLRPDLGGLARQCYAYARTDALLVRSYAEYGVRGGRLREAARELLRLARGVPRAVVGPAARGRWVNRVASLCGRIDGSWRLRTWAL